MRVFRASEPSGNIHAIAVNIVINDDDVAEVYAKPKFDPFINTNPNVSVAHAALHFNGTSYRVNHGREIDQHAVPRRLDNSASMFFDFRIDQRLPMRLQLSKRAFLVHAHEAAVAGYVRSQNCCKPAFHEAPPTVQLSLTSPSERIFLSFQECRMTEGRSALH